MGDGSDSREDPSGPDTRRESRPFSIMSYLEMHPVLGGVGILSGAGSIVGWAWVIRHAGASIRPVLFVLGALLVGATGWLVIRGPLLLERFRRTEAVGAAPALIAYSILALQLRPSMEAAADFASEHVGGRLGRSLGTYRLVEPTGRSAYEAFARSWGKYAPFLDRSVSLLGTAVDSASRDREEILERALDTALSGAQERVSTFATDIRGPAMGIYAFGVMLPLSLVGMMPVVATTGGRISLAMLAFVYDVFLPLGLLGASGWLIVRRPAVSAPSVRVSDMKTDRPVWQVLGAGLVVATTATVCVPYFLPAWSGILVAIGTGSGTSLLIWLAPLRERRETTEKIERALPAALGVVGQRLAEGAPIESAISTVATRLPGEIGSLFEEANRIRSRLGVDVKTSFHGDPGALEGISSERIETAVSLVLEAGGRGPSGGETLRTLGTYLETLDSVKREARRDLSQTTSTLRQTAIVFAPAIAGVTVALATGMNGANAPGSTIDVSRLGQVIGVYVLSLAVILPTLAVSLERGFAPVRTGYRAGIALVTSALLYPVTFLAARSLVYL
ncbi:MAG: hypothetical protein ABEJ58_08075 [Halodesulfurarchaeum sp.]